MEGRSQGRLPYEHQSFLQALIKDKHLYVKLHAKQLQEQSCTGVQHVYPVFIRRPASPVSLTPAQKSAGASGQAGLQRRDKPSPMQGTTEKRVKRGCSLLLTDPNVPAFKAGIKEKPRGSEEMLQRPLKSP